MTEGIAVSPFTESQTLVVGISDPYSDETSELVALRAELEQLQAERRELMELLGTTRSDRLIHDVRNLLQERIFLLAACRDTKE